MNDIHGFFFVPPIENNYIGHQFAEIYRDRIYAPFVEGKTDMTILDIGANIGATAYYFSRYAKTVYAVEPSLEQFDILARMIAFNKIKNIVPVNKAIYIKNGTFPLFHNKNKTMYSLHQNVNDNSSPSEDVETITIQGLMDTNKIDEVDLMKLDVEGSEVEILSSTSFKEVASRIKTIITERHAWSGRHENQLIDALKDVGYQVNQIPTSADVLVATR